MTVQPAQIELCNEAYETIVSETAKRLPMETGGILLGYREDVNMVVTHALVVGCENATHTRYIRNDAKANALLAEFLAERAEDDPTGYIGEWHSHPAPQGPSQIDLGALRETAKTSNGPIVLVIHAIGGDKPFFGRIARRQFFGRTAVKEAMVSLPKSRFEPLSPLPDGAVRGNGPVFISYRQSDGKSVAELLEDLLRAAGLVVWRDGTDLRAGTTTDRLEQALTHGLSAAVLVVTPEIVYSEIVRERELPRLLELDQDPAFSLCIANTVARAGSESKLDYDAPDLFLRLAPARTLADKKQSNMLDPSGALEIVRDLLMHRVEQRQLAIRNEGRAFTIRVQSRPSPFAIDAGDEDLHIRLQSAVEGRLPSKAGLNLLQTTLPLTSDAVFTSGATTVRLSGGAHLSIGLALGAALPETKIGNFEVADVRNQVWSSVTVDDPLINELNTEMLDLHRTQVPMAPRRVAIFVSLTPDPDRTAFNRLLIESAGGFSAAAVISVTGEGPIDSREAARLSESVARKVKGLAAADGRAEVHLAFHGPFGMAALIGRHLNTLRTVAYEWCFNAVGDPAYQPALVIEPGVAGGPIAEVLLA